MVPSAILDYINQRWMDAIEDQMPLLVRGISEIQQTGLTFVQAFDKIVENRMVHPPLSEEVDTLTVTMSWGLSFEEALRRFRDRIASPIVNRFCALILEASRSGGQIRKVFAATSGFMQEMKEMDRETSSQMRPYLLIIYTAFLVFVITSMILLNSFFVPMEDYTTIFAPTRLVGVREFRDYFYRTMLVSGLLGGLMAGKIGGRRVAAGLKHAIALMVAGYVIFYIVMPPNWMVP
jgi:flagellar protein FlaJ